MTFYKITFCMYKIYTKSMYFFFHSQFSKILFYFIFDSTESLLLCMSFLQRQQAGPVLAVGMCFSLWWLLLSQSVGSRACRLRQLRLAGPRVWAQQLWYTGLVAPSLVGSSWTRDQTRVPCIGRRIPICATREVPELLTFFGLFGFVLVVRIDC